MGRCSKGVAHDSVNPDSEHLVSSVNPSARQRSPGIDEHVIPSSVVTAVTNFVGSEKIAPIVWPATLVAACGEVG